MNEQWASSSICGKCGFAHAWEANQLSDGTWTVSAGIGEAGIGGITAYNLPDKGVAAHVGFQLAERLCERRQHAASEARNVRLLKPLRAVEWIPDWYRDERRKVCPDCGWSQERGHDPGCRVALALVEAAVPAVDKPQAETGGTRETTEPEKCPICGMSAATGYPHLHTDEEVISSLRQQLADAEEERDGWHDLVVRCEQVYGCSDTAQSPLRSNLVNLCRHRLLVIKQALDAMESCRSVGNDANKAIGFGEAIAACREATRSQEPTP